MTSPWGLTSHVDPFFKDNPFLLVSVASLKFHKLKNRLKHAFIRPSAETYETFGYIIDKI